MSPSGKIALTGGIATGKSAVATIFADLGARILDADQAAREAVKPGTPCWQELKSFLGPSYFEENGTLKRRKLREEIIRNSQSRLTVNAILHPCVMREMDREWRSVLELRPDQIVIFDIPLLFEADLAHHFKTIILVYTSREIQIRRLMLRDGLSHEEALETLTIQLPIDSKRSKSHLIIDNSYDPESTRQQVEAVWKELIHQGSLNISI